MVLDKLSSSLRDTLSKIAKSIFIDEKLIDELIKDIQRALLSSDVNVKLVFELSKQIKERSLKEKPPAGISQKEYIIKIVYEELVKFLGGKGHKKEKDPVKIYKKYEKELNDFDLVLIDTSGRDSLSKDLIKEITDLNNLIKPNEKLLVISADIGQAAMSQAKAFHDACNITGIVITKLDGTAKGGGALSAAAVSGAPVKFIGVGEKVDDLETFNPEGFVSRMLGMGDLEAFLKQNL